MLYVILIILLIIALLLIAELWLFTKIDIHLKDNVLVIKVITPLYRKVIKKDFNKQESETAEQTTKNEKTQEKTSPLSDKMAEIKGRVFNSETGFDKDELKKVWDEFTGMYSETFGIIKKLLGKLRHKIHISKLVLRLEYGTDNPATTGFVYGSIWNIVGIIYPILTMYFHIVYPTIDVTPDFYSKRFDTEVRSIIKVRAVHIISAGLSSLLVPAYTYLKNKKGREKNGR